MRSATLMLVLGLLIWSCVNPKATNFQTQIAGDWQIENATLQSYIRFDKNGKVTYFFNRFSYEKDTLAEYGNWQLKEILPGISKDTFAVEIMKQPQNTLFKFIFDSPDKIKVVDDYGDTFFTRVNP